MTVWEKIDRCYADILYHNAMCESVYSRLEERYMVYSKGIHYK